MTNCLLRFILGHSTRNDLAQHDEPVEQDHDHLDGDPLVANSAEYLFGTTRAVMAARLSWGADQVCRGVCSPPSPFGCGQPRRCIGRTSDA